MSAPPRLLCASLPDDAGVVLLDAAASHHARVLRLRAGDAVVLFDGHGGEALGVVRTIGDACEVDAGARKRAASALTGRLVLVQAWPKSDKIDSVVRMATELGASEIRIVSSEHAVAAPDADRRAKRIARCERIAEEAARQSGRADVPAVTDAGALSSALSGAPAAARRWMAHERAEARLADEITRGADGDVWVAVGPEGGFSPAEVRAAEALGWRPMRIAPDVLRVETAAPVAVALAVQALWRRPPAGS